MSHVTKNRFFGDEPFQAIDCAGTITKLTTTKRNYVKHYKIHINPTTGPS